MSEGLKLNRLTSYFREYEWNKALRSLAGYYVVPEYGSALKCIVSFNRLYIYDGKAWLNSQSYTHTAAFYGSLTAMTDTDKERWDLVVIDTTGPTIIVGAEAAVGAAVIPDIPEDKVVLALLYIDNNDMLDNTPSLDSDDLFDWRVFGNYLTADEWFENVGEKYLLYQQQILWVERSSPQYVWGQDTLHVASCKYTRPNHNNVPGADFALELVMELYCYGAPGTGYCTYGTQQLDIPNFTNGSYELKRAINYDYLPLPGIQTIHCYISGINSASKIYCRGVWLNYYAKVT